jgi:hypothetical protein
MDYPREMNTSDNYPTRADKFIKAYCELKDGDTVGVIDGVVSLDGKAEEPAILIVLPTGEFPFSVEEIKDFMMGTRAYLERHYDGGVAHLVEQLQDAVNVIEAMHEKPERVN